MNLWGKQKQCKDKVFCFQGIPWLSILLCFEVRFIAVVISYVNIYLLQALAEHKKGKSMKDKDKFSEWRFCQRIHAPLRGKMEYCALNTSPRMFPNIKQDWIIALLENISETSLIGNNFEYSK